MKDKEKMEKYKLMKNITNQGKQKRIVTIKEKEERDKMIEQEK